MASKTASPDGENSAAPRARFSVARGGLFYLIERRLGLTNEKTLGIGRRILAFWCVTWLPIMVVELVRVLSSGRMNAPYALISDLEMNVRLIFSGPILIAAEMLIDRMLAMAISQFEKTGIIADGDRFTVIVSRGNRQIKGAQGVLVESGLLALLFTAGVLGYGSKYLGPLLEWKRLAPGGGIPVALKWYLWIALPLLRFLQLRWAWRFLVWARMLWGISALRMNLFASHPDQAGGLGFLVLAQESFALLWLALSAAAASTVVFRVKDLGQPLEMSYSSIGALVGTETLLLLVPLAFFVPQLILTRRRGLVRYGALSSRYVKEFDRKWIERGQAREKGPLLGTPDIQSLADLGNGFDRVRKMRIFPAETASIMRVILAGLLPFLPLALLVVPIEQIVRAMIKLLM